MRMPSFRDVPVLRIILILVLLVVLVAAAIFFWPYDGKEEPVVPAKSADTAVTVVKAEAVLPSFKKLEWKVPLGQEQSEAIAVTSAGSDTLVMPRGLDILMKVDSTFEYTMITPEQSYLCKGESCTGFSGRPEWLTFKSKLPGEITFWFEPHMR